MKRRTRLFVLGDWTTPVFDSDTSDMHPVDYLLYGPHREVTVVHEIVDHAARVVWRWSGIWSQTSRRKYTEHNHLDYLNFIALSTPWAIPPAPTIPTALLRNVPEPTEEERRRSLRYQPVTEALADVLVDADLSITVRRDEGR